MKDHYLVLKNGVLEGEEDDEEDSFFGDSGGSFARRRRELLRSCDNGGCGA